MGKFLRKYAKQIDSLLLIVGNVIGLNVFTALKLTGIDVQYIEPGYRMYGGFYWWLPTAVGVLVGTILVVVEHTLFEKAQRRLTHWQSILLRVSLTCFIIAFCLILVTILKWWVVEDIGWLNSHTFLKAFNFLISPIGITLFVFLVYISMVLNFFRQLGNHFGHGIMLNFITGKYATPQEENRIFLFIDLKKSTQLAEKLGHVKYSRFINMCFNDLSELVVHHEAEIYQYVGDEVILSWENHDKAIKKHASHFYFDYCALLQNKRQIYLEKFNHTPAFKAALHSGSVMVSEIGQYRKELAYHGDVLNTTARLLELCSRHQKDFLLSGEITKQIDREIFVVNYFQDIVLRGKEQAVQVYEIFRGEKKYQLSLS